MGKRKPLNIPPSPPERAKAEAGNIEAQAQAAKADRARQCEAAIQGALQKFNCTIRVLQASIDGQPQKPQIQILALDSQAEPA